MTIQELIAKAKSVAGVNKPSETFEAGEVGCALVTDKGNVYTGVSMDVACDIGFCAEHSAIAAMITARESRIAKIVAIADDGNILPPCGRCREMIFQANNQNLNTEVIISENESVKLAELLPRRWQDSWEEKI